MLSSSCTVAYSRQPQQITPKSEESVGPHGQLAPHQAHTMTSLSHSVTVSAAMCIPDCQQTSFVAVQSTHFSGLPSRYRPLCYSQLITSAKWATETNHNSAIHVSTTFRVPYTWKRMEIWLHSFDKYKQDCPIAAEGWQVRTVRKRHWAKLPR